MRPISIYIVEDELLISASLRAQLQHFGYEILGASTRGESCLAEVEQLSNQGREPEIILMDIHLRGEIDGIEAAKKINEKYNCGIIFLTGQSSKEVYERSFKIKPFGYLLKPIDMEQTRMTIEIAAYQRNLELKNIEYRENLETLLTRRTYEKNEIRQMYQSILDNSPTGILILSVDKTVYANKRCAEIFGLSFEDFMKLTPSELFRMFHEEDQPKITGPTERYFANQIKSYTSRISLRLNHSGIKWLETQIDTVEYLEKPALCLSFFDVTGFKSERAVEDP